MTRFDRFAAWCAKRVSQAPFFAACVLLVLAWLVQGLLTVAVTRDPGRFASAGFQLEINTTTTIVTFLLVALLQNGGRQAENAFNFKLDRLAEALAGVEGVDRESLTEIVGAERRIGA